MSAGSFWRSASRVTITAPRAAWKPAANAAVCPAFAANATTCSSGWSRFNALSTSSDPSDERPHDGPQQVVKHAPEEPQRAHQGQEARVEVPALKEEDE